MSNNTSMLVNNQSPAAVLRPFKQRRVTTHPFNHHANSFGPMMAVPGQSAALAGPRSIAAARPALGQALRPTGPLPVPDKLQSNAVISVRKVVCAPRGTKHVVGERELAFLARGGGSLQPQQRVQPVVGVNLPTLNYILAQAQWKQYVAQGPTYDPEDVIQSWDFAGAVVNEHDLNGASTAGIGPFSRRTKARMGPERVVVTTVRGTCDTWNYWGDSLDAGHTLYLVLKRVACPAEYALSLTENEGRADSMYTSTWGDDAARKGFFPYQFCPLSLPGGTSIPQSFLANAGEGAPYTNVWVKVGRVAHRPRRTALGRQMIPARMTPYVDARVGSHTTVSIFLTPHVHV